MSEVPMTDPLAYFLTWTTYGTWLPGDDRGWVRRGQGHQPPDPERRAAALALMTETAVLLDGEQRRLVEATIARHCEIRGWMLHIVRCGTNHVHVVVTADRDLDTVRDQFKAWATRRLKELQASRRGRIRQHWWTEKGSARFLYREDDLAQTIIYVRDFQ